MARKTCKNRALLSVYQQFQDTTFFQLLTAQRSSLSIVEHVAEGNGMRKTGRLTKVGHFTVRRYTKQVGEHAEQLHDELVAFSPKDGSGSVRREMGLRKKKTKKLRRKPSD